MPLIIHYLNETKIRDRLALWKEDGESTESYNLDMNFEYLP